MNANPMTRVWNRSTAENASYSAAGICPVISTISQLTNCTMVNAP